MRKWLVLLAMVAVGCSGDDTSTVEAEGVDDDTTTTSTTAAPDEPLEGDLRVLVASGSEVLRWVDGDVEPVAELDGEVAVAYGDGHGAVVAQVDDELVEVRDGEAVTVDPGAQGRVLLFDLATIDGEPAALYGLRDESQGEAQGDVLLLELDSGELRPLTTGYAPEYHVFAGSIGGGMLAVSAYSDLSESVTIYPIEDGVADPTWSPTIDLEYNAPPLVLDAILSPDASTIAWLSGPDTDGSAPDAAPVGEWEVVVATADGLEQARFPLDLEAGERGVRLDYDGVRLLVSIATEDAPAAPILLEVGGDAASQRRLGGVTGVATFDA